MTTRHPSARRVHRPDPTDDDVFVHGVLEGSVWAKQNARNLIIGAIAVIVLVAGVLYWRSSSNASEARAAAELNTLRATLASGNTQLALRDGQTFLAQYGGTDAGREARVLVAQLHLDAGQPAPAVDVLEPIADDVDEPLGFNAAMLLGAAHEAADQIEQAERVYLRIGSEARFTFERVAGLEDAARVRAQGGDAAGAIALYEQILEVLEDDAPGRAIYEMRLAELAAGGTRPVEGAAAPADGAAPAGTPTPPAGDGN